MHKLACMGILLLAGTTWVGCTATRSRAPMGGVYSLHLQTLQRSEFTILDTVEGRGTAGRFLCFFRTGDKKFGYVARPGGAEHGTLSLLLSAFGGGDRMDAVAAATYDALQKVPEADYILPLTTTASRSGIPCFWSEAAKVRGKAIKIKSDQESIQ